MRILLAIILNAVALAAAAVLSPGITVLGSGDSLGTQVASFLFFGAIFGVVNVVIKPIVSLLSLPITCLTLGLFAVVINALMLMLTGWLTGVLPWAALQIDTFWSGAVLGSIIVSLVSALLNRFLVTAAR